MKNLKHIVFVFLAFIFITIFSCNNVSAKSEQKVPFPADFARGADISWCTEMENDGIKFYDRNGTETDCFALMKNIGMNAIRLRVWVDPKYREDGVLCNKADTVKKAERAHSLGMDVMIDFHLSDFFTDPGHQEKPAAWKNYSKDQIVNAIETHVKDVLSALKDKGITPKWVQIGNEINPGILWDEDSSVSGGTWESDGTYTNGMKFTKNFSNLASYITAGYNATKSIFPNAEVIIHLADGYNYETFKWIFDELKSRKVKFDMIGMSHYPQNNNGKSWKTMNSEAVSTITQCAKRYGVKVMVVEVGTKSYDEPLAKQVLSSFMESVKNNSSCAGVFYWEPEVYNYWTPECYDNLGWDYYDMGAFTTKGKPASVLDVFSD